MNVVRTIDYIHPYISWLLCFANAVKVLKKVYIWFQKSITSIHRHVELLKYVRYYNIESQDESPQNGGFIKKNFAAFGMYAWCD